MSFKKDKNVIDTPIVIAIISIFIIVPRPGFRLRGNQKIKTITLIKKVERPMPILIFLATPSAKTVQGVTPYCEITKTLSPSPNKNKPIHKIKNVLILGLKILGLKALHETNGTELIKNILDNSLKLTLKNFIANLNLSKLNIRSI